MGEKERKPFQLTFNGLLKVDFQGIACHFRRWLNPGSGVGRAARSREAD